jgi:hypothetical protein
MVRQRKRHDVARVVVHEADEVEPLVLAQQKREDVALPELVGLRPLEAPWWVLTRPSWCLLLDETCLVKDGPHLRLAHTQPVETGEHVAYPTRAIVGIRLAHLDDRIAFGGGVRRLLSGGSRLAWDERV